MEGAARDDIESFKASFSYQFIPEYGLEMSSNNVSWMRKELIPLLSSQIERKEELKILGVGSGTGHSDCVLLKEVINQIKENNKKIKILYTVVEPDENAVRVFEKENSIPIKELYNDISFTWHATPMEEFFANNKHQKFDVVYFIHSLCWRGGRERVFREVLANNIGGTGILFAVSGEPNNIWLDLRGKFVGGNEHSHHHHHHHHESNDLGKHGEFDSLNFDKENSCKSMCFLNPTETDVTEILEGSVEGLRKLDALLDRKDLKGSVKESEFQEILKRIEEKTVTRIVDGKKRSYVCLKDEVVIIWRE